jgi:uncharacterized protein YbaP (TraB family)
VTDARSTFCRVGACERIGHASHDKATAAPVPVISLADLYRCSKHASDLGAALGAAASFPIWQAAALLAVAVIQRGDLTSRSRKASRIRDD